MNWVAELIAASRVDQKYFQTVHSVPVHDQTCALFWHRGSLAVGLV